MNTKKLPYKYKKLNADTLTPIGIFQRLKGKKKFLLESTLPHERKGKYSFIGSEPYEEIIGHNDITTIRNLKTNEEKEIHEETLQFLNDYLPKIQDDLNLSFTGGAIGYVGYDAIRSFENLKGDLPNDLQMPEIHLMLYKNIFVFDHEEETVYLIAMNPLEDDEKTLDKRLHDLQNTLQNNLSHNDEFSSTSFQPEIEKETFLKQVKEAKKYIQDGEALQIVLSQRFQAHFHGNPFSYYRKLRRSNPSPYMFYIDFDSYIVLGASPESLIQVNERKVITNPIAGTRPRGKNEQEDQKLMKDLLQDQKEISEHKMLIDLSRNDLNRIAKKGTIAISSYMEIEKFEHVMHIVSEIECELDDNFTCLDALISCLPAGTVSGAPKVRAMQLINKIENKRRNAYAGGIGYIGFNRNLNMTLTIRSLIVKDGIAYLQVGAGIVHDSKINDEYEETLHKARSLMEVEQIDFIN